MRGHRRRRRPSQSRTSPTRLRDAWGFSVVEMLVVFTVLALAMLPLASIQLRSRGQINEAARETQALQLAQAQIERVKMMGFESAVGDSASVGPFTYETEVIPDAANPFLSEIRTTVTWDHGGDNRSITLASKLAAR